MKILSTVAELRIKFKGVTDGGMEVDDCIFLPLSLIKPDPANAAIMLQAAQAAIATRLGQHETARLATIEAQKNAVVPTKEERVAAILDSVDEEDIEAVKAYFEGKA